MTHIQTFGDGDAILFLHGGPGLTSSYMTGPFRPLAAGWRLCFYDQFQTRDYTLAGAVAELHGVLDVVRPACIIAHSWGAFLLLSALPTAHKFDTIFIGPQAMDGAANADALDRLLSRFSDADMAAVNALKARFASGDYSHDDERAFMQITAPHYMRDPMNAQHLDLDFSFAKSAPLQPLFGSYDLSPRAARLPGRSMVILGAHDYIVPDNVQALMDVADKTAMIGDAGHYPFIETPAACLGLIDDFLKSGGVTSAGLPKRLI